MSRRALAFMLCAVSSVACGDPVKLGDDTVLPQRPRELQLGNPPPLTLTARSAAQEDLIRVPLACADQEPAACPGYEPRLWVDQTGVWLANVAQDQQTVQLAHLDAAGRVLASARWTEPDPFRTVSRPALWRSEQNELRLALLQDGCDLQQVNGTQVCAASAERVRVLAVSDSLSITPRDVFLLQPGFKTTQFVSSAAGAVHFGEIEYKQPVAGGRLHIRLQRFTSEGDLSPIRVLRMDFSSSLFGRAAAIDAHGQIGFVLDSTFNHAYSLDASGDRAAEPIITDPQRMLETVMPAEGGLVLGFRAPLGFELVDVDGQSYRSTVLVVDSAGLFEAAPLYLKHARLGPDDIVDLLFHHSMPEGAVFCRVARRAMDGFCLDLGSADELWDMHSSDLGTWIAIGGNLLGIRPGLTLSPH